MSWPTAVVRSTVRLAELPEFLARALPEVAAVLERQQVLTAGRPFAFCRGGISDRVDVEVGVPVSRPITPSGTVRAGTLPTEDPVIEIHIEPYEAMEAAYFGLRDWMTAYHIPGTSDMDASVGSDMDIAS